MIGRANVRARTSLFQLGGTPAPAFAGATAIALIALGCAEARQPRSLGQVGVDTLAGGIVRITSNAATAWPDTLGWKLVYERSVQPPAGSPGELARVFFPHLLPDGRLLLRDESPVRLKLFDERGEFVRTIGREGDGPGEYRQPHPFVLGDSVFIHDPQLARGTVLSLDGTGARTFPTTCCFYFPAAVDSQRRFRTMGPDSPGKGQWLLFAPDGTRIDSAPQFEGGSVRSWTVRQGGGTSTFGVPLTPSTQVLLLASGALLHGSTDRYELAITPNGRDTTRLIARSGVEPVTVPDAVRDSLFRQVTRNALLKQVASRDDIPRVFSLWKAVKEDGAGNIWVLTGGDAGLPWRLDVFSSDGRFLGAVPSPFTNLFQTSWSATHVAAVGTDSADEPIVRVYRIVR